MDELLESMVALREAAEAVRAAAEGLKDLGEPPDYGDLVDVFVAVDDVLGDLREAKADVGEAAHHALPTKNVHVSGLGPVEKTWGYDRKEWRHAELAEVLLARSRDERRVLDDETGEFESEGSAFLRVLLECAGFAYWKLGKAEEKTGLRGRGIDADDFSRREPKRPSINVPSRAKRAVRGASERRLEGSRSAAAPETVGAAAEGG